MADLQAGIEGLNHASHQTPEGQPHIFALKKQLVDALVADATIDTNRDIRVNFRTKIMAPAVSRQLLDFPNGGEIEVRL